MIQKHNQTTYIPTYITPNRYYQAHEPLTTPNLQISNGIQLIQCINYENNIFKKQQKYLEIQLNRLKSLSDSLLGQNIQLRELYKGRTIDISNLIKTITLRTNENIVDYQHKSFLFTEMNCRILKQIKLFVKQIQVLSLQIDQKSQEEQSIRQQTTFIQQQILNKLKVKLQLTLNRQKLQERLDQESQQSMKIHKMQQQINQFLMDNKAIEMQLSKKKLMQSKTIMDIKQEKQEWLQKLQYIKEEVKVYRDEVNQDQADLEKVNKEHSAKEQKYKQSRNGLLQMIRKYEAKQAFTQQCQVLKASLINRLNLSHQHTNKLQTQLSEVTQSRKKLQQQISSIKSRITVIKGNKLSNIEEMNNHNKQNLINLKNTMSKNHKSYDEQMLKLASQHKKILLSIQHQDVQYTSLQQKVNEYKKIVSQLNNPIGEIEKIELMMRLKNKK